jgi:phosphate ABC transporter phosphate-binding protein
VRRRLPTRRLRRTVLGGLAAVVVGTLALSALTAGTASADSFVPVSGEGSSWSANALNQWIADVQQQGMRINYTANGSTTGRQDFIKGLTDFAATDIPFQTNPTDGSAPEHPQSGSYAYIPITAGGTVFMYNLKINGQQVTNLRLSGINLAKIYTGVITNWDDPALAADNPALKLPNQSIVPVVRSDGSGSSYELTEWMISQYPAIWNAYCAKAGRAPSCGATSFYPTVTGMIAQNGDLGVASYVAQSYASGSIGYVNYSYALDAKFPVAQMLNSAGYYTEPTAQNVAVSLLQDQVDTTDVNNPALYLTQNLSGVYTDNDPRTYPLSSYGYLVIPTTVLGQFSTAKGHTLAAFTYYALCQGQNEAAPLGYSPMPINLVQAGFDQIGKIPGVTVQAFSYTTCNNPHLLDVGGQPAGRHRAPTPGVRQAGTDPVHHGYRRGGGRLHSGESRVTGRGHGRQRGVQDFDDRLGRREVHRVRRVGGVGGDHRHGQRHVHLRHGVRRFVSVVDLRSIVGLLRVG